MTRRSREKEKITDPHERARLKKARSLQRREERKARRLAAGDDGERRGRKEDTSSDYAKPMVKDDYAWIRRGLLVSYANKIINEHRQRPYWLSITYDKDDGAPPVSNFYPCATFRSDEGRIYYGFLFREHRDLFFDKLKRVRKETIDSVRALNPSLFS